MLKARRLRGALVAVLPFAWLLLVLPGCAAVSIPPPPQADPLSAWNSGAAKSAILEFVARVTDASGPDYVAPEERIAVFDNDGTLMVERPTIVQFEFLYRRIRELAPEHPEWTGVEPFRSVLQNDRKALSAMGFAERGRIVAEGQADMYHADFAAAAREFLATARHPRFGARFTDLVYRPMLELIAYLQANRFRVFVVSGGGVEFIRRYSEPVYGVPRENVIGSSMQTELRERDGRLEVYRVPGIGSVNAGRKKPLNIQLHIGRRPIFAVGNSDSDLDMMRFADDGPGASLIMLLEHDDAEREYVYTRGVRRARAAVRQRGWQAVSMRDDFRTVFRAGN